MNVDDRSGPLANLIPEPFVIPKYEGLSVANVPATIGALLSAQVGPLPPLEPRLWSGLGDGGVDRVVLILADALGWLRLRRALEADGESQSWLNSMDPVAEPITSIYPSTTSSTLITLWTGAPPAIHGITGYTVWMPELGVTVDTIGFQPAGGFLRGNILEVLGERAAPPLPTLPEQLAGSGVETHMVLPAQVLRSGLTVIQSRGASTVSGFVGLGDCLTTVRHVLEHTIDRRAFVAVYLPTFDDLSHLRGPEPEHWDAEWRLLAHGIRRLLIDGVGSAARARTVVALTADHGQVTLDPERFVSLADHPLLADCLILPPTGDARAANLYVRDGAREAARMYAEVRLSDDFEVLDGDEALDSGLWGPGPAAPGVRQKIGDLVLLAREGAAVLPQSGKLNMRGTHGGLLPEEAIVPWIAWRLDS
jgi:hypothetical protein